jgi:hypothetical protein
VKVSWKRDQSTATNMGRARKRFMMTESIASVREKLDLLTRRTASFAAPRI